MITSSRPGLASRQDPFNGKRLHFLRFRMASYSSDFQNKGWIEIGLFTGESPGLEQDTEPQIEHSQVFEDDAEPGLAVDGAKAAAVDVQAADHGHDGQDDEEGQESGDDQGGAALPDAEGEEDPGQDLEPGQDDRGDERQRLPDEGVVADVLGEVERLEDLDDPGVDE